MFGTVVLAFLFCGLVSGNPLSRIINGDDTDTAEHPHQVSLQYSPDGNFSHICGGSIVGSRWVLTAAHCVEFVNYDESLFRIVTNNGKLTDPDSVSYTIESIIPHENYDQSTGFFPSAFPNDIALLKLSTDIASSADKIAPLAETSDTLDGRNCTITGWGRNSADVIPNVLQKTTGTILTRSQCESDWNTLIQRPYSHEVHVCIDNDSTGSCNGDSGGPMMCDGKLSGVTSWGANGCATTMPSVYVRLPNFRSWIQNNMN